MALSDFANMHSKDILAKLNITQAPFDPFEIASLMGVKVLKTLDWEKVRDIKDGHIYLEKGEPIIWINPLRPENRQKFTLAHELGHLVYDILPNIEKYKDSTNGDFKEHYRNGNKGPQETRANRFAANLLMPIFAIGKGVDDIHKSAEKPTTDKYIDGLASIFEVSRQARIVRLKALGVISQDYIYPYV